MVASLVFDRRNTRGEKEGKERFEALFHVADIEVDTIISYPWLRSQRIGVFPHLDTLAKLHPEQRVLTPRSRTRLSQGSTGGGNLFSILQRPREAKESSEGPTTSPDSSPRAGAERMGGGHQPPSAKSMPSAGLNGRGGGNSPAESIPESTRGWGGCPTADLVPTGWGGYPLTAPIPGAINGPGRGHHPSRFATLSLHDLREA